MNYCMDGSKYVAEADFYEREPGYRKELGIILSEIERLEKLEEKKKEGMSFRSCGEGGYSVQKSVMGVLESTGGGGKSKGRELGTCLSAMSLYVLSWLNSNCSRETQ